MKIRHFGRPATQNTPKRPQKPPKTDPKPAAPDHPPAGIRPKHGKPRGTPTTPSKIEGEVELQNCGFERYEVRLT